MLVPGKIETAEPRKRGDVQWKLTKRAALRLTSVGVFAPLLTRKQVTPNQAGFIDDSEL